MDSNKCRNKRAYVDNACLSYLNMDNLGILADMWYIELWVGNKIIIIRCTWFTLNANFKCDLDHKWL